MEIECKRRVFKRLRLIFELREFEVSSYFRVYDGVLLSGQKKNKKQNKKKRKKEINRDTKQSEKYGRCSLARTLI